VTDLDVRSLYLDLIRRNITRYGMPERMPADWPVLRRLLLRGFNTLHPIRNRTRTSAFGEGARDLGLDCPAEAETMIGMQRLTSL
jgi:O-methyltransferase